MYVPELKAGLEIVWMNFSLVRNQCPSAVND